MRPTIIKVTIGTEENVVHLAREDGPLLTVTRDDHAVLGQLLRLAVREGRDVFFILALVSTDEDGGQSILPSFTRAIPQSDEPSW
ncbi:MAG: hypothetical protein DRH08_08905 [Deltaproteobacteria bacterium]|nr:MAG: hypothetical protein DRH08_08905 [Deltaproteobacteria bacterium]